MSEELEVLKIVTGRLDDAGISDRNSEESEYGIRRPLGSRTGS